MAWNFFAHHLSLVAELAGVFAAFFLLLVGAAMLFAYFEQEGFENAVYFAFITAFTVGFGDIAPHTRGGRIVTVLVAFMGLVIIGIVIAVAGEALERALAGV
jgi:voltage-gated potassium channel